MVRCSGRHRARQGSSTTSFPTRSRGHLAVGSIVRVPLHGRRVRGWVDGGRPDLGGRSVDRLQPIAQVLVDRPGCRAGRPRRVGVGALGGRPAATVPRRGQPADERDRLAGAGPRPRRGARAVRSPGRAADVLAGGGGVLMLPPATSPARRHRRRGGRAGRRSSSMPTVGPRRGDGGRARPPRARASPSCRDSGRAPPRVSTS